ncbi:hypothetical protein [Bryobacter aggregatus]|uniref:hypothetical protein n=1 Tax=Bryobacter aggregatus TaxID=360054 RepID=UPI0004E150AA|nr:hypothetical protein [Bryobacter aggregatus]
MVIHPVRRQSERGYALLFVFVLSAITALTLYNELPRAVFESQRAKEELLLSRGQEYQRGIQLYYRKLRKYPTTIEDLEKTSGVRFLRRRYVDPFSGKDDWRFVHINASGQYTDSKVIKPPSATNGANGTNSLSTSITQEQPKNDANDPALKRRASDTSAVEIGSNGSNGAVAPTDPYAPPSAVPAPYPGANPTNVSNPNNYNPAGMGGVGSVGSGSSAPGGMGSGSVGVGGVGSVGTSYPAAAAQLQSGGHMIQPNGQRPLTPEQLNPAMNIIQGLLTTPRTPPPGIVSGNNGGTSGGTSGGFGPNPNAPITNPSGTFLASGPAANGGNGQLGGGGIAGVASKHEGRGIKLVNDRDRIEEWEFIYDYAKDRGGRPGSNTQSQQSGINPNSPLGNTGSNSGFGNNGMNQNGGNFGGGQNNQSGFGQTRR